MACMHRSTHGPTTDSFLPMIMPPSEEVIKSTPRCGRHIATRSLPTTFSQLRFNSQDFSLFAALITLCVKALGHNWSSFFRRYSLYCEYRNVTCSSSLDLHVFLQAIATTRAQTHAVRSGKISVSEQGMVGMCRCVQPVTVWSSYTTETW